MDFITKKTEDMLTEDNVSILTQIFIEVENSQRKMELMQVGKNHRVGYKNSIKGRKLLQENEPPEDVEVVMKKWGDTPTVDDEEEITKSEESETKSE